MSSDDGIYVDMVFCEFLIAVHSVGPDVVNSLSVK